MQPSYASQWPVYAKQWDTMEILPARLNEVNSVAQRLFAAKTRYSAVEQATTVPWYMIACIHERESSQDWKASLAQGDRWDRVSTHVPAGRGPFASWEAAAIDALHLDGLTLVTDWRVEKTIYYWTKYNGWGYYAHNIPSPYVFGATTIQKPGKYIRDGIWSANTTDTQIGCAVMLKQIMILDPTISIQREN